MEMNDLFETLKSEFTPEDRFGEIRKNWTTFSSEHFIVAMDHNETQILISDRKRIPIVVFTYDEMRNPAISRIDVPPHMNLATFLNRVINAYTVAQWSRV